MDTEKIAKLVKLVKMVSELIEKNKGAKDKHKIYYEMISMINGMYEQGKGVKYD